MEDLLFNIVKEAGAAKLSNIKQNAQEAYGELFIENSWVNHGTYWRKIEVLKCDLK